MKKDEEVRETLLIEAHRCIERAADETVAKIGRRRSGKQYRFIDPETLIAYPPNGGLSADEDEAIRSMQLSPVQQAALRKLVADGAAAAFFHFLNLIDATGDPTVRKSRKPWLGAWLVAPKDDRDQDMLHDRFYETYAEYERAKSL